VDVGFVARMNAVATRVVLRKNDARGCFGLMRPRGLETTASASMIVVINWFEELKARLPAR